MDSEMLLLGAGASVEAEIPDAKRMAEEIIKKFEAASYLVKEAEVLNFVNEQLIAAARKRYRDQSIDGVDIEALYNAVLLLYERQTLEISPFVKSWHPKLERLRDAKNIYWEIMFRMELMLGGLTAINGEPKVDYLKPVLNLVRHQNKLFIATLNYDYAIELLSRANGIVWSTGIESWISKGVFEYPDEGIGLIKLHGSNYWLWSKGVSTYEERLPHNRIHILSRFDEEPPVTALVYTPMVIFGQRNKLTTEGPFLDLLKQFDEQLQHTDILTVIGYSFRDTHINSYITKYLNQYKGKIRIVDPSFERSDIEYVQYLRQFREAKPDHIMVIEKKTGEALRELYSN